MSLHRLHARVCRLEQNAARVLWWADVQGAFVRLLAEASAEIGLSRGVQELCTVCAQTLRSFTPAVPPCVTDLQAVEAFMALVTAAVVAMLDTHVPDPSTRYRLRKALSEACQREALRRA